MGEVANLLDNRRDKSPLFQSPFEKNLNKENDTQDQNNSLALS